MKNGREGRSGERKKGERILSASRKRNAPEGGKGRGQTCRVASCCPPLFTCPSTLRCTITSRSFNLSCFILAFFVSFFFIISAVYGVYCAVTEAIDSLSYVCLMSDTVESDLPLRFLHE